MPFYSRLDVTQGKGKKGRAEAPYVDVMKSGKARAAATFIYYMSKKWQNADTAEECPIPHPYKTFAKKPTCGKEGQVKDISSIIPFTRRYLLLFPPCLLQKFL